MINNTKSLNVVSVPLAQSKRIEFIDAMRGFTIFLVVLNHVALHCLGITRSIPSLHEFFYQVRMPMFFMISGFVLYKDGVVWDKDQIIRFFKKKIPVQLLSPLLFFVVFMHVRGINFVDGLFNEPKYGFWFTYILFVYFVIYAFVRFLMRNKWADIILVIIGICLLPAGWPGLHEMIPIPRNVLYFFSFSHWQFFFFFVLGTLLRKYYPVVQKWLDKKWTIPICIMFYFCGNAFKDLVPIEFVRNLPLTLAGLVVLFAFFRIKESAFSKEKKLGRTMQYVGRRTLDIYLIHNFLLPINLKFITFFVDHPMPLVEASVSAVISVIIIAACLLVSNIIRLSPVLGYWIFGAKIQETK